MIPTEWILEESKLIYSRGKTEHLPVPIRSVGVGVFRKEASTFWGDSNILHLERSQGYTGAVLVEKSQSYVYT